PALAPGIARDVATADAAGPEPRARAPSRRRASARRPDPGASGAAPMGPCARATPDRSNRPRQKRLNTPTLKKLMSLSIQVYSASIPVLWSSRQPAPAPNDRLISSSSAAPGAAPSIETSHQLRPTLAFQKI